VETTEINSRSLEQLQSSVDELDEAALRRLLTATVRSYARRSLERPEGAIQPFATGAEVAPTEALVTAGAILRAAEISSFELATIFNM
jgi:hypothetical protein